MEQEQTVSSQVEPVSPASQVPKIKNSLVLIMSILLIITVGIAGLFYFQIQKLSKQLTQLQAQVQSTPTPTANQAPTGDLANWKTYTSVKDKYQISYPQDWKIDDTIMGTSLVISNPNKKYPDGTLAFSTVQGQNSCDSDINSAKNWNWQNLQEKSTSVGEMKGTELSGKTDYTNGIYYDRKFILIKGKNSCYTFDYWSYDGSQTNTFNQILSTFKFSDNEQTIYQCPTNGWQNCMPILTEEAKRGCTQEAIKWYETNCPNFQGVAQ